jgi:hypothetical protein
VHEAVARALGPARGVNAFGEREPDLQSGHEGEVDVPRTFVDYEQEPREIGLNLVQTVLQVHSRVTDVYNSPYDQLDQQMRLAVEGMKERQEWDLINDRQTGLLGQVAEPMRIQTRGGAPTPDDMDDLLSLVWKQPALLPRAPQGDRGLRQGVHPRGVPPPHDADPRLALPHLAGGAARAPSDKLAIRAHRPVSTHPHPAHARGRGAPGRRGPAPAGAGR